MSAGRCRKRVFPRELAGAGAGASVFPIDAWWRKRSVREGACREEIDATKLGSGYPWIFCREALRTPMWVRLR